MHSIWKLAGNIFSQLKMESQIWQNVDYFPGNLGICFQILVSSGKARLNIFQFTGLGLANVLKCIKLFALISSCQYMFHLEHCYGLKHGFDKLFFTLETHV